jgi:hypothetical protein
MRLAADGDAAAHRPAVPSLSTASVAWRRSSRCSTQSCVEIADLPGGDVAVRDSKSPDGSPILIFGTDEWKSFISGVKAGEFG